MKIISFWGVNLRVRLMVRLLMAANSLASAAAYLPLIINFIMSREIMQALGARNLYVC